MLNAFLNIFRIPDLRNKVLFTLGMLVIYRIGFWVPLIGVDQTQLAESAAKATQDSSGFGRIAQFASIFSGGSLSQSTIFGLGIMPYITASIIFQLLNSVLPGLQELKKEGASGQQKISEWTRYATVGLCIVQAIMWLSYLRTNNLVQPQFLTGGSSMIFFASGIVGLTAGSVFLMWLGEQIDKYGIGNGVSVILTAGILARLPEAIQWIISEFNPSQQGDGGGIGLLEVIFLAIIAIIPTMIAERLQIPFFVASFLGGTGLLIVVSVGLDIIQRIEANLLMRNYAGFLSGDGKGGSKIRGRRN
jgi:preprotein translocase subunit SecY